ncbi:site-specific integrase [Mycobacterium sp. IS-3022]|uniref:tyrosine-type recombinase/integrase n=1 Tax=Mycobacterium sp. IS-3022 TaxID=1772277 RepID=UPI0007417E0C|nr:site-specific integrase [Mycobacterium sp. IS-3022]KUH99271.1 integrase [Mycobacterium sp. IS-3022]
MAGKAGRRGWGYLRRLPSKRWQASYIGPDLTRHRAPRTYTAKMDAEHWLADERRLIERDEWTPPSYRAAAKQAKAVTVARFAEQWLEHRDLKPRTRRHYDALLTDHINPVLGPVPLRNLTPEAVRAWHAATLKDRPTYRAHAYGLLHAILGTAVTDGLLDVNPCHIPRAAAARSTRKPTILAVADVAALADAIDSRYRALVLISAWCGLRWGEVTELRRKDIDGDVIAVARGVTHRNGQCHIDTPKSGRVRAVVMPPHIRDDIAAHLSRFVAGSDDALLFPADRSCHLSDKTFRRYFAAALKSIGHEHIRIHDLRHFAGTQAARVGNLRETMDRLGHTTITASLRYQGIVSGRDAAVAEALSELANAGG